MLAAPWASILVPFRLLLRPTARQNRGTLLHQSGPSASRPFVVTPYRAGAGGILAAEPPDRCPLSSPGESSCHLTWHHSRRRKTGPGFALEVFHCQTHGRHFTLYPPGFAPYQRQPLLGLAPDGGEPIADSEGGDAARYAETLFEAAVAARDGQRWSRESKELKQIGDRWWSTQNRHLDRALLMLGLAATLSTKLRELIASVLSVDLLTLLERSSACGYRQKGAAICAVLEVLSDRRLFRLLSSGQSVGLWGDVDYWDRQRRVRLFRLPGTRSPP